MGALTEAEIFDRQMTSLRLAAELCDDLAILPLKGVAYDRLRRELRLIEGCCKQAAAWREDTRWLPIGMAMAECHRMAGEWLRGVPQDDGTRRKISLGEQHPLFKKLAEVLRGLALVVERTRDQATGRVGMILPVAQEAPHRQNRPVPVRLPPAMTRGSFFLPACLRDR